MPAPTTLTVSNTYSGSTTISGGSLQIGSGSTTGRLTDTTSITNNGNLTINRSDAFSQAADLGAGVAITGTGSFTQAGAGTTTLTVSNTYSGATTISGGSLQIGSGSTTGRLTDTTSITNNANLTINRSDAFSQATDLGAGVAITGTGSFTQAGAGTTTLTVSNSYTGATTVSAGTLSLGVNDSLSNTSAVSIGAATLDVATSTDTVGTLDPTAAATINLGTGGALAFADSSAVDWTSGSLNITVSGPLGATAIQFGTTTGGLTSGQLAVISVNGAGAGTYVLDASGYLVLGSVGPLDHFAISTISSPQTVGTPITGITLTAQDASNATVTGFTGTVTFSGTAGITGTSGSFIAGVLTGVSVTPSVIGASRTFIVTDGVSGKFGTATFTVQSLYDAWATANGATGGPGGNTDGDTLTNLQEFAFGTDPTVSTGGSIVWVAGGAVTTTGSPVAHDFSPGGGGVDYRAVYGRRKDYVAAGLTYTVQFSADMLLWQSAPVSPAATVQTGAGGLNPSEIEAVSVPYPSLFVPLQAGGFGKATLLRVEVSVSP